MTIFQFHKFVCLNASLVLSLESYCGCFYILYSTGNVHVVSFFFSFVLRHHISLAMIRRYQAGFVYSSEINLSKTLLM